jgi:hypothetical protein
MEQLVDGLTRAIACLGEVELSLFKPSELPDRNI